MFKRRSVQRNINKINKNKALATVGMAVGTTLTAPIVSLVAPSKVYAQTSQESFIAQIAPAAQRLAAQNDLYASVMIAQAILETGWGKSTLSAAPNYNLFGIKGAYNGQSVIMRTAENTSDGTVYYISAAFRKYPSYTESLQDYVNVLKGSSFYSGAWKSNTISYQQATLYLTGRYATAVNYNTMLNSLIAQYNLTQYDTANSVTTTVTTPISTITTSQSEYDTYIVQSGDSIWKIANQFNMTMNQLRVLNAISNDFIYPNQVLKVKKGTTTTVQSTVQEQPSTPIQPIAATTPIQSSTAKTYTVQSGDSVWLISNRHNITMAQLREWNNLSSDLIHPGQTLKVSKETISSTTVSQLAVVSVSTSKTYTVQSGDSVWKIAYENGMSMSELRALNGLSSDLIHPGQVLKIV